MSRNRLVYQNWIVEIGHDPRLGSRAPGGESEPGHAKTDRARAEQVNRRVAQALGELGSTERGFLIQFYYLGKTYHEISNSSGRPVHRLESLHERALKSMRKRLRSYVSREFGLAPEALTECPICRSRFCDEIDQMIAGRDRSRPWTPVLHEIRQRYQLDLRSPHVLIGHERYH